ncbi:MAG: gamma-glutamyltransferase [Planctomycetaceae bacterium]|nr:gamma-glutamyltransferase [Planctomycetaceae bacterium]MDG2104146.1 gamma-glutamyltransferase [Pirellulaceae bacterium]
MILRFTILVLLVFSVDLATAQDRITGRAFATRSEVIAKTGMAATSQPLATQVALDILKKGGSAVDAAIAANATLGLMEPTGNGIGGDLFAIVWDNKTQKLYGLNASGRSPRGLSYDKLKQLLAKQNRETIPPLGPLPVSVPGCVDGWCELHQKFGKLPLSDVLQPAIDYANDGFPVSELIAYYWASGRRLAQYPGFAATFLPNGKAPAKGEIFKNPMLATTLGKIAKGGRNAFYEGEVAQTIASFLQENGGYVAYEDLAEHKSEWVQPVGYDYRGYKLWELPPNGQGIAALQILGVLEGYDIRSMGFGSPDHVHHFVEAKKLAFEDRAKFYADQDFHKSPVAELISPEYAAQRRKLISSRRAARRYDAGNPALEQGDTIYLTVADKDRNMVSLIQSNYRGFGSGMCPPGLGFCLQDRGELFDMHPDRMNTYAPGKRPFHTIIPAFVTKDGKPFMSFGVMGGATQPQGHAQIMINMIDFDMNIQEAGDAPRILHSGSSQPTGQVMTDGGTVSLESGFDYETVRNLMARGHTIEFARGPFGGYQGIKYDALNDVLYGASESRKDGQAAGY